MICILFIEIHLINIVDRFAPKDKPIVVIDANKKTF